MIRNGLIPANLFVLQPKGKKLRNHSEKENQRDLHNLTHAPIDLLLGFRDNNNNSFLKSFHNTGYWSRRPCTTNKVSLFCMSLTSLLVIYLLSFSQVLKINKKWKEDYEALELRYLAKNETLQTELDLTKEKLATAETQVLALGSEVTRLADSLNDMYSREASPLSPLVDMESYEIFKQQVQSFYIILQLPEVREKDPQQDQSDILFRYVDKCAGMLLIQRLCVNVDFRLNYTRKISQLREETVNELSVRKTAFSRS